MEKKRSFWEKPWGLKEGFAIGAGIIIAGLVLEASIGPVVWEVLVWPANIVLLGCFVLLILIGHFLRRKVHLFSYLATYKAAVPTLSYAVVLTVIMGVTRQKVNGRWLNDMLSFWPFVLIYVYITFMLGLLVFKRLSLLFKHSAKTVLKTDIPFLLNHLGLFLTLACAVAGNGDKQDWKVTTQVGETEWRGLDDYGKVKELDIAIELKKFIMEEYPSESGKRRMPKRFASEVQIYTKSGKNISATVDVNKPLEVDGWKIYQYGYDEEKGTESDISILELVKDPWLEFVYAGIWMMIAGAACLLLFIKGKDSETEIKEERV